MQSRLNIGVIGMEYPVVGLYAILLTAWGFYLLWKTPTIPSTISTEE